MIIQKHHRTLKHAEVLIIEFTGAVQLGVSGEFALKALRGISPSQCVILDFGHIDYAMSTGMGELIGMCAEEIIERKNLALINVPERVMELIHITRIPQSKVFPNLEKAAKSFEQAA